MDFIQNQQICRAKLALKNACGIYDMHGNVSEWCKDGGSAHRMLRGGNWNDDAKNCRSADRSRFDPAGRDEKLGFRVALVPIEKAL